LLNCKAHLPKTDNEYTFNLRPVSTGLVVREAPNLVLEKLGGAKYSPEEKLANKKAQDLVTLANRLSPAEREELIRLLEKAQ